MSDQTDSPENETKFSALAVASILLGILGFATLWVIGGLLLAGAGVVLGHLALHDIRFSEGKTSGKWAARAGLVISYLALAVFPLIGAGAVASLPAIKELRESKKIAKSESSREQAHKLYIACEQFSRAHQGRYPRSWDDLSGAFLSPAQLAQLLKSPHDKSAAPAYELIPHERPIIPAVASSLVVIQEKASAEVEKVAIVYANGTVDMIENPDRF